MRLSTGLGGAGLSQGLSSVKERAGKERGPLKAPSPAAQRMGVWVGQIKSNQHTFLDAGLSARQDGAVTRTERSFSQE